MTDNYIDPALSGDIPRQPVDASFDWANIISQTDGEIVPVPFNLPPTDSAPLEDEVVESGVAKEPPTLSFGEKLRDVGSTFKDSWQKAGFWGKTVLFGAVGAQGYERFRIPEIVAPPIAVDVYMETGSAFKTALTLGGLVAGQQLIIGATWAETLAKYGNVAKKVGEHFPKTVELAEDIGPSQDRGLAAFAREGYSGYFSYGTTPFLVAEKTYSPSLDRGRLHLRSLRIATAIGLAGVSVGKALVEVIEELPPEYQDDVIRIAEMPYPWIALAALFELPRYIKKRQERRNSRPHNNIIEEE